MTKTIFHMEFKKKLVYDISIVNYDYGNKVDKTTKPTNKCIQRYQIKTY